MNLTNTTIDHLVSKFSDKTLPKEEWTHQAHILVALWYNKNNDFDTALDLVRSKIKAYNLSVGTINSDDSGYHETLTVFWMTLTKSFLLKYPAEDIAEVCTHFLESKYANRSYPFEYYSKAILFSTAARKNWIKGDKKELTFILEE